MSLFDFENHERLFPAVYRSMKLALLTLGNGALTTDFVFFATALLASLLAAAATSPLAPTTSPFLNPNTSTCPVLRSRMDAEFTNEDLRQDAMLTDEALGRAAIPGTSASDRCCST